jgi:hypothetical protein
VTILKKAIAISLLSLFLLPLSAPAQEVYRANIELTDFGVEPAIHTAPAQSMSIFGLTKQQKKRARAQYKRDQKLVAAQKRLKQSSLVIVCSEQ